MTVVEKDALDAPWHLGHSGSTRHDPVVAERTLVDVFRVGASRSEQGRVWHGLLHPHPFQNLRVVGHSSIRFSGILPVERILVGWIHRVRVVSVRIVVDTVEVVLKILLVSLLSERASVSRFLLYLSEASLVALVNWGAVDDRLSNLQREVLLILRSHHLHADLSQITLLMLRCLLLSCIFDWASGHASHKHRGK